MDTPLDNPDIEIFTNGSSCVRDGKCKAGYAVVTAEQVLEAKSLPQRTSAQLAELVAVAYLILHAHAAIWKDSLKQQQENLLNISERLRDF